MPMKLYMDIHGGLGDATPEDLDAAHKRDLAVQHKHGVRFLTYWFNDPRMRYDTVYPKKGGRP